MPRTPASTKTAARKTASKTAAPARKRAAAKPAAMTAFDLLKEDHKKVKKMFRQFEKMQDSKNPDDGAVQMLVESACMELMIHARLEEELFYPALRKAMPDKDLLDEAEVEHASAKMLIQELQSMHPGDNLYEAKFTVLGEYVSHHIDEEEKEMFPKARKLKIDYATLGQEMQQRRETLRTEMGMGSGMMADGEAMATTQRKTMIH